MIHHHACTALGILALALAMALWVIMTLQLKHFVPPSLEEDSALAKVFARPPAPSYKYIYVFHINNYEDWAQAHAPPAVLKELGPYVFRMETTRNLRWFGKNLSYTEKTRSYFEAGMSKGALSDNFTTVNIPAMLSAHSNKNKTTSIFMTTTIEKYFLTGLDELIPEYSSWKYVTKNKFAWLAKSKESKGQTFTVNTQSGLVNQIIAVDNQTFVTGYKSSCSDLTDKIAGFGLLPAFRLSPETVTIYEPTLCVPWTLGLQEQYNFGYEPIARFHGGRTLFNATPETCKSDWQTNINGTFDASPYYGNGIPEGSAPLPLVLSFPHFLYGDPALHSHIKNLKPSEEKHSFYIDVHAPSGFVVDMKLRSQLNIKFAPHKNMAATILPLFWHEVSRLPDGKEKMVASVTVWPLFAGWMALACTYSLLAAALFLGLSILLQGPVKCWEFEEEKQPNTPDDIPTDELSSEPEEDLRREQRRRALRARLPAGLPVYFKIHKGDLDDLGVTIPEWVLAKIQQQIEEQGSTSSSSSDEISSDSWSTVSSRSTSPGEKIPKSEPASEPSRSHTISPVLRSSAQEKAATPDEYEEADRSHGSCLPEDPEEEVQEEGSA